MSNLNSLFIPGDRNHVDLAMQAAQGDDVEEPQIDDLVSIACPICGFPIMQYRVGVPCHPTELSNRIVVLGQLTMAGSVERPHLGQWRRFFLYSGALLCLSRCMNG